MAAARSAFDFGEWPGRPVAERIAVLRRFADLFEYRLDELGSIITNEIGSPTMFSHLGQVGATLMVADYYANLVKDFAFEEERQGMMSSVLVRREPVGVVGAIVPWNVPLYVTMLKLAPALAAGATMVLKPAPESPLSAYLLAEALEEAGLPKGVVNILPAGREVGEHLVRHPGVDKIAFTGSTVAGMKIASLCGEQLKRYTLELGGKSAAIILDDADVDATLDSLLQVAGLMNNGQACVAQTRVLASKAKYDEVVNGLATRMEAVKVGDPAEMDTEVGPLVAERQRDRVEKYIVQGQEEGAEVVVGGGRPSGQDTGWYVEPTLFAKVDQRHAHRPGGDLRAGHLRHRLRRRGRRRAHRQRLELRPVRLGLDRRRRRRRPRRRLAGPYRHLHRQRLHARVPAPRSVGSSSPAWVGRARPRPRRLPRGQGHQPVLIRT